MRISRLLVMLCVLLSLSWMNVASAQRLKKTLVVRPTGKSLGVFVKNKVVWSVAFSPDGKTLACDCGKNVQLWDVKTGKINTVFEGHTREVYSVAFSPDGKTVVSAGFDAVRLWEAKTGKQINTFGPDNGFYHYVTFSPDGKTVASTWYNKEVHLWDISTGRSKASVKVQLNSIRRIFFSPDSKSFFGIDKGTLKNWESQTGQLRSNYKRIYGFKLALSPDGKTMAALNTRNEIELWSLRKRNSKGPNTVLVQPSPPHAIMCFEFSPDGKTIAGSSFLPQKNKAATHQAIVLLWDVQTGKLLPYLNGHLGAIYDLSYSPDGKMLASCGADGTVKIWDLSKKKE